MRGRLSGIVALCAVVVVVIASFAIGSNEPTAQPSGDSSHNDGQALLAEDVESGSSDAEGSLVIEGSETDVLGDDASPSADSVGPVMPSTGGALNDPSVSNGSAEGSSTGSSSAEPDEGESESEEAGQSPSGAESGAIGSGSSASESTQVPVPVSVPVPTSSTSTSVPFPTVACTVSILPVDTQTEVTTVSDRRVWVGVEVIASEPIPAVWTEVSWGGQSLRSVIQLSPMGVGQILVPTPGEAPVSAAVFTESDFSVTNRRCVS